SFHSDHRRRGGVEYEPRGARCAVEDGSRVRAHPEVWNRAARRILARQGVRRMAAVGWRRRNRARTLLCLEHLAPLDPPELRNHALPGSLHHRLSDGGRPDVLPNVASRRAGRGRVRTSAVRLGVLIALAAVVTGEARALTPAVRLQALVTEGKAWWTHSPDSRDPVACATCHHDPAETRGWPASFPKYRPLPPPDGRVMTLLQANAEAVQRHYGLADPERPALAITA